MGRIWSKYKKRASELVITKSVEEQNKTLSEFLEDLHRTKLHCQRPEEEISDIIDATHEMVSTKIRKEIYEIDKRFEPSEVLFVGSMAEGTSIGEPDEFDFLFVLQNMCTEDEVDLIRVPSKGGNVFIHAKGDAKIKFFDSWAAAMEQTFSDGKIFKSDGFSSAFRKALRKAISKCIEKEESKVSMPTGHLVMNMVVHEHGPANKCLFHWFPSTSTKQKYCSDVLAISIDITPALQFEKVNALIDRTEVGNDILFRHLVNSERFFAIQRICDLFKLSFTNTELCLMNELSTRHKQSYRLLKYMFNDLSTVNDDVLFHSYALKTFVVRHQLTNGCPGDGQLATCVTALLTDIQNCLGQGTVLGQMVKLTLPSLFLPAQNVLRKPVPLHRLESYKLGLKHLFNFIELVSTLTNEEIRNNRLNGVIKLPIIRRNWYGNSFARMKYSIRN